MNQPSFEATTADDLGMELATQFRCRLPLREYQSKRVTISSRQARFIHSIGLNWSDVAKVDRRTARGLVFAES